MENPRTEDGRLNLAKERYDQTTFKGRYKSFFEICNPFLLFNSEQTLLNAKDIVMRYRKGEKIDLPDNEIWHQKLLYDAAFHPVTETIIPHAGRMSAQCPINAVLMGAMMIFYRTNAAVIFWNWANQSFDAFVNMMNSSDAKIEWKEAGKSYAMAVGSALPVAVILTNVASKMKPLTQRLVPLLSVILSNSLNLPLCRQNELRDGIQLWYQEKEIVKSRKMAVYGITAVLVSRLTMQLPHMLCLPFVMTKWNPFFSKNVKTAVLFQLTVCTISLIFSTPLGCSLFPHKMHIPISILEQKVQEEIKKKTSPPATQVYFNKGL